jgi:hypothetical protein
MDFSAADTARVFREHRSISVDEATCVQVVAVGYRKVHPQMDRTGTTDFGDTSATAVYDSTKPLAPAPPQ